MKKQTIIAIVIAVIVVLAITIGVVVGNSKKTKGESSTIETASQMRAMFKSIYNKLGDELPDLETAKIDVSDAVAVKDYTGLQSNENVETLVKVLTNDTLKRCKVYNDETKEYSSIYNLNKINSLDKYDVYLSGATPMLTLENPDYNGTKELIVFRDSYGSSLIPLLVTGYSKITVVDTRYISPKLLNQYIEFKDQDVLFMYSTLIINNSTTLK